MRRHRTTGFDMTHTARLNKLHPAPSISIDKRIWVWFNGIVGQPGARPFGTFILPPRSIPTTNRRFARQNIWSTK